MKKKDKPTTKKSVKKVSKEEKQIAALTKALQDEKERSTSLEARVDVLVVANNKTKNAFKTIYSIISSIPDEEDINISSYAQFFSSRLGREEAEPLEGVIKLVTDLLTNRAMLKGENDILEDQVENLMKITRALVNDSTRVNDNEHCKFLRENNNMINVQGRSGRSF